MSLLYRVFDTVTKKHKLALPPAATWEQEIPSGTVDGINQDFVLAHNPASKKSTLVFIDSRPIPISDWTLDEAQNKITLNEAPVPGQLVYALYLRS